MIKIANYLHVVSWIIMFIPTMCFGSRALSGEQLRDAAIGYGIIFVVPIVCAVGFLVILSFFALCFIRNDYSKDYRRFRMYTAITAGSVVLFYVSFAAAI
jgi:hypothetical protein